MKAYLMITLAIAGMVAISASITFSSVVAAGEGSGEKVATMMGRALHYRDYHDGVFKVMAGGGGPNAALTRFFPKTAEIKVGETVTWYNPSRIPEPHTVTFFQDNSQWGNLEAPLVVNNTAVEVTSKVPGQEGSQKILKYFGGSIEPKVVKADGTISQLAVNSTYSMDGTEQYINSGWIWPAGQTPEGLLNISSISIKFEKAGTYDYLCLLHPWMSGKVIVR
jgi:plastocyanin